MKGSGGWPRGQEPGLQPSSGLGCRVKLGKSCPCLIFYFFIMDIVILTWPVAGSLYEIICMPQCSVPCKLLCQCEGSGLGLMQAFFRRNQHGPEKAEEASRWERTQALGSAESLKGQIEGGEGSTQRDTHPSSKWARTPWAGEATHGKGGSRVLRP